MSVTIKDVALAAGVNPSTVSRVMKDSPSISEKTKLKVRKAMSDLGYTQNSAARMLASGKAGAIGVVFPPVQNKSGQPFFMKILTAINERARESDITVSVATGYNVEDIQKQVQVMHLEKRVDGFILLYAGESDPVREYLIDKQVPFIMVGTPLTMRNELSYVDNDNQLLGYSAFEYLYDLGHRQIGFVTDTHAGEVFHERYSGYQSAARAYQADDVLMDFDENALITRMKELSAVVVMDDVLAVKTVDFLRDHDLQVPDDISVVSFNNSGYATLIHPYLTSFDINIVRLGQVSVEKLLQMLESKALTSEKTIVPFEIIERESTIEIV
jgi:LacI family transcriptional regulator